MAATIAPCNVVVSLDQGVALVAKHVAAQPVVLRGGCQLASQLYQWPAAASGPSNALWMWS